MIANEIIAGMMTGQNGAGKEEFESYQSLSWRR
jgi:hypothetical protein